MKSLAMVVIIFGMVFWLDFPLSYATEDEAKKIFMDYGCVKCHSISAYGITVVEATEDEEELGEEDEEGAIEPPDLSDVGTRLNKEFIAKYLRKKADKEGRKHKKRFKGSKDELKKLVEWMATLNKPPIQSSAPLPK